MAILPDFRDFKGRYSPVISHSAKGTTNRKYVRIKDGKYIYTKNLDDEEMSAFDRKKVKDLSQRQDAVASQKIVPSAKK